MGLVLQFVLTSEDTTKNKFAAIFITISRKENLLRANMPSYNNSNNGVSIKHKREELAQENVEKLHRMVLGKDKNINNEYVENFYVDMAKGYDDMSVAAGIDRNPTIAKILSEYFPTNKDRANARVLDLQELAWLAKICTKLGLPTWMQLILANQCWWSFVLRKFTK